MNNLSNFFKGLYSYFTFSVIFLTVAAADSPNFGNWMILVAISVALGYGCYRLFKSHTEDEINTFLGLTYLKEKFNLDFISEPDAKNPLYDEED